MSLPKRPKILVVDDEKALMKALCEALVDEGFESVGFTSGNAALESIKQRNRFDLLLTDLMMPEIDGITLLHEALKLDPQLVGIIMTGAGTIATAVEAMKKGALDYVLKPFKVSTILPVIGRAMLVRRLKIENEELLKGLQQRTAELEVANKELEAFSYSVSHDLRAPLRTITGFSKVLTEEHTSELSTEARRLLDIVNESTERMGQLIDDLLRLSRLSRKPLSKRSIPVSGLVQEVIADLDKQNKGRQIDFRIGNLPDCFGDRSLLKQVFVNLISNGLKFTQRTEKPVIEIQGEEKNDEKLYTVRDNGVGFDMRYVNRLFNAFQRLHSAEEFEGTGIGLSIVHRIITRHGGKIWAEAEPGQGAAFHFTLPAEMSGTSDAN
jgi:two-component system sensor histidine kinase/response regulator